MYRYSYHRLEQDLPYLLSNLMSKFHSPQYHSVLELLFDLYSSLCKYSRSGDRAGTRTSRHYLFNIYEMPGLCPWHCRCRILGIFTFTPLGEKSNVECLNGFEVYSNILLIYLFYSDDREPGPISFVTKINYWISILGLVTM